MTNVERSWHAKTPNRASLGKRVGPLLVLVLLTSVLIAGPHVAPAQAAPGFAETPQAGVSLYSEDFQNQPAASAFDPPILLDAYVATDGSTHSADADWLTGCNGLLGSFNHDLTSVVGVAHCDTDLSTWTSIREAASDLATAGGDAAPAANIVLTIGTTQAPAAGVIYEQSNAITVPNNGSAFLMGSIDIGAMSCTSPPLIQMQVVGASAINLGTPADACTDADAVTQGTLTVLSHTTAAVAVTDGTVNLRVRNERAGQAGNDGVVDNIALLDVTPQLDKEFAPA